MSRSAILPISPAIAALLATLVLAGAAPSSAHGALSAGFETAKSITVAISDSDEGNFGSGVVVAPGYVLTAAHVIQAAEDYNLDMTVTTSEGTFEYDVVSISSDVDLALIRAVDIPTAALPIGNPNALTEGQEVYALGYPLGSQRLVVTKGIISTLRQEVEGSEYVQTDASINPGNSGGPLVDAEGRLVGINVVKNVRTDVDNTGYAVPLEEILSFLSDEGVQPTGVSGAAAIPSASAQPPAAPSVGGGGAPSSGAGGLLFFGVIAFAGIVGYVVYASRQSQTESVITPAVAAPVALRGAATAQPVMTRGPAVRIRVADNDGSRDADVGLPAVFGRASDADVTLADAEVSRHHARLRLGGTDRLTVEDLASSNGLRIGGERVASGELIPGVSFQIGNTTVSIIGILNGLRENS